MPITRRNLLRMAAGTLNGAGRAVPPRRPNILFLLTDDQRFSTLHALNNGEIHTPNMDRLVRRGVTFTKACIMGGTVGAVCAPSRAMLMTGQSLFHVTDSIVTPRKGADSAARPFVMFPELLRQNGYRTFGTGKWHNGEALYARCFNGGGSIFFGGMSDHLQVPLTDFDPSGKYPEGARRRGAKFSSELFSDAAVNFLEQYQGDDPFFLYVAYTAPHDPRVAPAKFANLYPWRKMPLPKNFLPRHPFDNGELEIRDEKLGPFPRTPDAVRQSIAGYYAMITEVDEQMGRVLQALESSGRADNTIVVFASDNGLALGQHGLMGKQNLYDHSVRVPLVIGGPGLPRGKRVDSLCYLMDLFPTFCDLTGLKTPPEVEGKSLMPAITGREKRVRDSVFLAYKDFQRAVRTADWKLILYNVKGKETTQLFDMRHDALEMRNLAGDPAQASRIRELRALLKKWMAETQDRVDLDKPNWGRG
jgi:arylsulfatase A-like enzyme